MLIFRFVLCFLLSSVKSEVVLTPSTGHLCHFNEAISLLQFKKGMLDLNSSHLFSACEDYGQFSYPNMISWNKTSQDCCRWDGVKCHEITGHIIGLDLSCSFITGVIHQNSSIFHLSHLQKLNLAHNDFSNSKLSPNIGKLSRLAHLNFSYSRFEGIIPSDLSNLSKLQLLDLSGNGNLNFSPGHFHILLRKLSRVRVLCLNYVNILANLPENWSSSSLTYLDLGYTELRGKLPTSIFHLHQLRKLVLDDNQNLRVNLPKSNHSNSASLQILDLSNTNLNADGFTDSISSFVLLKSLRLSDCEITGAFPNSISNLSQIVELDLSVNKFVGDFSSIISNLPAKLATLSLNWNYFKGEFPSDIRNITQLSLSRNLLNGTLPFKMNALSKLISLDLSGNAFNGQIPVWLFSSPSMTHLDVSYNCLEGQIIEFTAKSLVQIDLSSNNLSGTFDFTVFKHLRKLEYLKLSHNKLLFKIEDKINLSFPNLLYIGLSSCEIKQFPSFLINSKNLIFLDLSNNKLIGQVPYMIPRYPLNYLNLSQNALSGLESLYTLCVPDALSTLPLSKSLQLLDLSSNKFQELLPLFICSFEDLNILDLSHNNFTGSIPECYGGFNSVLQMLNMENNDLSGIISMKFPKDNRLMYLNLKGNSLLGILPESLGNCKKLKVLDVGNNRIKDRFPNLGSLINLHALILKSNRFFGSINIVENEFFLSNLQVFDISCNDFNGVLPVELLKSCRAMTTSEKMVEKARYSRIYRVPENQLYRFSIRFALKGGVFPLNAILTTLVAIDVSSNHFVGAIPEILGNLSFLRVLNLSHNNFSGLIPSTIGELHYLESLDLSCNRFRGMIPWQLADVTFLEILNLSQNLLVGPIPQGKQFNTFFNDSYSGNLGLCGFPLTIKCVEINLSLHSSQASSYEDNQDSCFLCEFPWNAFLIGYIFGMVFGCFLFIMGESMMASKEYERCTFLSLVFNC